jgi:CubicO group peptidase (beta-lactamase class C family)
MEIKKQLLPEAVPETFHLSVLNTDKNIVDSIISSMNDSTKIQLILGKKLFFIDTLDYNMIGDSIFFKEYIDELLDSIKNEGKLFYAYYPAKSKFDDITDSSFFNFQIKRYRYINRLAEKKALFAGWVYPQNIQTQIKNLYDSTKIQFVKQQNFLKAENIFHIFKNEQLAHTHYDFEGLKISFIDTLNNDLNKEILSFLNSDYQLILIKPYNTKAAQETIAGLINKYPRYRNLFYKKLRKLVKFIYYLKKIKTIEQFPKKKKNSLLPYLLKEKSIFIIQNKKQILPLQTGITYSIINLIDTLPEEFLKIFSNYAMYMANDKNKLNSRQIKRYQHIILINNSTFKNFTVDSLKNLLLLFPKKKSIIINFGAFDSLVRLSDSLNIIQMPDDLEISYRLAPQVLFGGLEVSGQIPRSLNQQILFGNSYKLKASRLGYSRPERVNISSKKLSKISTIVYEAIQAGAFPGCQLLIAKNNKVIYNKSFGYHTYQKKLSVKNTDLYDIASLTKIAATTIATMKMVNDGKLDINDELGRFFRDTKIDYTRIKPDTLVKIDTFYIKNIENIENFVKNRDTIRLDSTKFITIDTLITKLTPENNIFKVHLIDLLKHKSGITPSLPIYKYVYYRYIYFSALINAHKTFQKQLSRLLRIPYVEIPDTILKQVHLPDSIDSIINTELKNIYYGYFSKTKTDSSNIQICNNLYLRNQYFDTIWTDTKQLPVANKKYTKYSDINMILLQMAIDSLNKTNINQYLKKEIYNPLGLKNISYLPLNQINIKRICPTEDDRQWRYCLLQGYVHDPSAAMLGGISGNAGLFANASDLEVLFQMILNGGNYGGKQYIHPDIIKQFTTRQEDTQRGLGFDMPNSHAVVGNLAPATTFGHSGFTGTCIWVDPENELIYVFLSNRVYPSAKNWKIISLHVRERIHDAIYEAIIEK